MLFEIGGWDAASHPQLPPQASCCGRQGEMPATSWSGGQEGYRGRETGCGVRVKRDGFAGKTGIMPGTAGYDMS